MRIARIRRRMLAAPEFIQVSLMECLRDVIGLRRTSSDLDAHLRAAMHWLRAAQAQTSNGGVAAGFGRCGWWSDYPETTGYIIPTFLNYYHVTSDPAFCESALRMGRYLFTVQTPDGSVVGGYQKPRRPYVFDTGQVILGWVALFEETQQPEFLAAARAAGEWLVSIQAPDGAWPSHDHARSARSYHSRVAWALIVLGLRTGESRYSEAGRRNVAWVLRAQRSNGWFAHAELKGHRWPVTHTIAYTIRGALEAGLLLRDDRFINAAQVAADALMTAQSKDGSLSGVFDSDWRCAARWRCLTGCAQMSINWFRLFQATGDRRYFTAATKSNAFLKQTQDLHTRMPVRGAIKGSMPFWGAYQRFSYPNWAAKFFADALMLERSLAKPASRLSTD